MRSAVYVGYAGGSFRLEVCVCDPHICTWNFSLSKFYSLQISLVIVSGSSGYAVCSLKTQTTFVSFFCFCLFAFFKFVVFVCAIY